MGPLRGQRLYHFVRPMERLGRQRLIIILDAFATNHLCIQDWYLLALWDFFEPSVSLPSVVVKSTAMPDVWLEKPGAALELV